MGLLNPIVLPLLLLLLFSFHGLSLYGLRDYPTNYYREERMIRNEPIYRSITDGTDQVGGSGISQYNVADFGAKGDGTDATKAFSEAWSKVCASSSPASMVVSANMKYLVSPIAFSGPCKSNVTVMIKGTLEAPSERWSGTYWILFRRVSNLYVGGGGTIDGNGQVWWENSCKIDKSKPCKDAPTALTFYSCNNVVAESLSLKDSQQIHVRFEDCNGVRASHLNINAPETSPNTDGIHVTRTQNILIDSCTIGTGDDCISIVTGSKNVKATNIVCGPGHGISIGSLGSHQSVAEVSYVTVNTAKLTGTTNGVRIKTWQGGSGYAKHISFQNINMNNVKNPIIIDQNYCDSSKPCKDQKSAVQISDVTYQNIRGTSASNVAMTFECSKNSPCQGIVLQDINLTENNGEAAKTVCANVKWTKVGTVIPSPCV